MALQQRRPLTCWMGGVSGPVLSGGQFLQHLTADRRPPRLSHLPPLLLNLHPHLLLSDLMRDLNIPLLRPVPRIQLPQLSNDLELEFTSLDLRIRVDRRLTVRTPPAPRSVTS